MTTKELAEALRTKRSRYNRALLDECAQRLLDLEAIAEFFHSEYEKIRARYMCHQCEYQYGDSVCCECVEHNKFMQAGEQDGEMQK